MRVLFYLSLLVKLSYAITYVSVGPIGSGADYECDGTNDDVQIQKALCEIKGETYDETLNYNDGYNSCGFKHPGDEFDPYPTGEGLVEILSGTYYLNRQLWVYSNTHINGTGKENTILKLQDDAISFYQKYSEAGGWLLEGGQSGILRLYFVENVTISHLTIDGNKDGQSTDVIDDEYSYGRFALYSEAARWVTFHDCIVMNCQGYGLDPHGVGGDDVYGEYLYIFNNEVYGNDWDGITIDKSRYVECYNNYAHDNGRHGINIVTGTEEAIVYNNVLENNGHFYDKERDGVIEGKGCGIMAQNNQLYGTSDVNIYNNEVFGSNYAGICLHSVYSFEVYDNEISNGDNWCIRLALQSENTKGSYNNKIYRNTCSHPRGIYITKDSYNNSVFENDITISDDTYGVSNRDETYSSASNLVCENTYSGVTINEEVYYDDGKYPDYPDCNDVSVTPAPTTTTTPAPSTPDPHCDDGILSGDVCCLSSCGTCGGSGCSGRDGGSEGCCTSKIRQNNDSCDETSAPCIVQPDINEGSDPDCDTGIKKSGVCCHSECGTCGGSGCSSRYLGSSYCCTSTITNAGNSCDNNPPPCVL